MKARTFVNRFNLFQVLSLHCGRYVGDATYFSECSARREVVSCVGVPAELSEYSADEPAERGINETNSTDTTALVNHTSRHA